MDADLEAHQIILDQYLQIEVLSYQSPCAFSFHRQGVQLSQHHLESSCYSLRTVAALVETLKEDPTLDDVRDGVLVFSRAPYFIVILAIICE